MYGQLNIKDQEALDKIEEKIGSQIVNKQRINFRVEVIEDVDPPMAKVSGLQNDDEILGEPLNYSRSLHLPTDGTWVDGKRPTRDKDGNIINGDATYIPNEKGMKACMKAKEDQMVRQFKRENHRDPNESELAKIREVAKETAAEGIPYDNAVPQLDEYSHGSAKIPYFTTDRKLNFAQAHSVMAAKLNSQYGGKVDEYGNPVYDAKGNRVPYTDKDVEKYCTANHLILHEQGDCQTLNKISEDLHNTTVLPHRGGYSNNVANVVDAFGLGGGDTNTLANENEARSDKKKNPRKK